MNRHTATSVAASASASVDPATTELFSLAPHVSKRGATNKSPIMSPTHQACQTSRKVSGAITPPSSRLVAPTVAPIVVERHAGRVTRATTSLSRSSDGLKPTTRERAHAPTTASSAFPAAIPRATPQGAPTQKFTRKAPSATPGQILRPYKTRAARAMPLGGQTSVANPPTGSAMRPSLPTLV
jgi:hypothetical protein